ncbi:MAG: type VI secretion system contractile sheath large subunit [Candidatus Competibacteraceae bacterium]|nr:type VI secretion system contractile sheath large subunit [Candidatus Competibacteraceae bacterium]
MPGRLDFQFNFATTPAVRRTQDQPMRILLLGNFRGNRASDQTLAERHIQRIDIDNFDQVLAASAPQLHLQQPDCRIEFSELDDFHPDQLYRTLPVFAELRQLRKQLRDPATAAQAIAQMSQPEPSATTATDESATPTETAPGSLFEQLLGGAPAPPAAAQAGTPLVDAFIRNIIAEHIVTAPDTSAYLNALDLAHSDSMRAILHNPAWQALEANWRGLWWLVSELVTDGELSLHLLDLDRAELDADLAAADDDPAQSVLYQRLTERSGADSQPWSLIVALYDWPATPEAVLQLGTLTAISRAAGGTLLSAASPAFAGTSDFSPHTSAADPATIPAEFQQAWDSLRDSDLAAWLGLALPRVLLRLPYGPADPIDSFTFDEQSAIPEHTRFLWGNPALACALVLGREFLQQGWEVAQLGQDTQLDIDAMPAYSYKLDGEAQLQACAETYLAETTALQISQQGLIPLLSFRHRNAVRVGGLHSCALNRRALLAGHR